jgi:hypothetical protein
VDPVVVVAEGAPAKLREQNDVRRIAFCVQQFNTAADIVASYAACKTNDANASQCGGDTLLLYAVEGGRSRA